ncbi:MAG TPA: hypothetical protein PK217_11270, partial [Sphingopyxis terrae]|nr:hypothetical protein [Sphingopyxis terrae]
RFGSAVAIDVANEIDLCLRMAAVVVGAGCPAAALDRFDLGGAKQREALALNPNVAGGQSRILWIRNDKTGQVIVPGQTQS